MEQILHITQNPAISAIYFAMLQAGYDFYALGKDEALTRQLEAFRGAGCDLCQPFFREARQASCEVYPFWPRAAALETASFHLDDSRSAFGDFPSFQARIMGAPNIADHERGEPFWTWIAGFPAALRTVMGSAQFQAYFAWEEAWVTERHKALNGDLLSLERIIRLCSSLYQSPLRRVTTLLCPIKCAYASDYFLSGTTLYYIAGAFRAGALLHEYLHPIVRPAVAANREAIQRKDRLYPDLDASYYLDGGESGRLNAFEEHMVRSLTRDLLAGTMPANLNLYLESLLTS